MSYREKYKNTVKFPKKEDYYYYFVYRHGSKVADGDNICRIAKGLLEKEFSTIFSSINALEKEGFVIEKIFDKKQYDIDRHLYNLEEKRLLTEFEKELYSLYGTGKEHVDKVIFSKAWEDGHSSGLDEVAIHFESYAEFFHDLEEAKNK